MNDALRGAQEDRLAEEEAPEDDQPRALGISPRRAPERQSEQAEQREGEQPSALVTEAAAEEPQRTGCGAEGGRAPRDRQRDLRLDIRRGLGQADRRRRGFMRGSGDLARRRDFAVGDGPRSAFLVANAFEAVVAEGQPEL